MRLVIIGSGNVANVLAEKFYHGGHEILQVAGRNPATVGELAKTVQASAVTDFSRIEPEADVYLVAVSDDALKALKVWLPQVKGIVAHTAGSVAKDVLADLGPDYGVFYPLQSLKTGVDRNAATPILIDGNNQRVVDVLKSLAGSISDQVQVAGDDERVRLHLAATVVNNFSNHLFALAYDYCKRENLSFDLLIPLIKNMAGKLEGNNPSTLQTGPAKRKDTGTIEKHLSMLQEYPVLKEFYDRFSKSIIDQQEAAYI